MANRATITYNSKTVSTEDRDGNFSVTYNSKTLATIGAGTTKTLKCSGKVMATDVVVGGKTLKCSGKLMATDVVIAVASLFPSAPSAYNLIGTYTSSQTWTAPEDGWYRIEDQGASGNGGSRKYSTKYTNDGGGGGGGGCAISEIKMKKGDTIVITIGNYPTSSTNKNNGGQAGTTTAVINSSLESYSALTVTGAYSGYAGSTTNGTNKGGNGGAGGVGSGGNVANYSGGAGAKGGWSRSTSYADATRTPAAGGTAGYTGGNVGGTGSGLTHEDYEANDRAPTNGSNGFVKIYAGNTN